MPTVQTFAVRETLVSRTANVGTVGKNWFIYNSHNSSGKNIGAASLYFLCVVFFIINEVEFQETEN